MNPIQGGTIVHFVGHSEFKPSEGVAHQDTCTSHYSGECMLGPKYSMGLRSSAVGSKRVDKYSMESLRDPSGRFCT